MTKIRIELMLAVCWFVLLFNIERLDLFGEQRFNLSNSVYLAVIIVSAVILLFPRLARGNLLVSVLVLFGLYVIVRGALYPVWDRGEIGWYGFEFLALVVSFLIMRQIGQTVIRFERAIKAFLLPKSKLADEGDPITLELIEREFYRARRSEEALSVLYCALKPEEGDISAQDIQLNSLKWRVSDDFKRHYDQVKMAQVLDKLKTKSDIVVAHADGIALVLPETELMEAREFALQISDAFFAALKAETLVGIAQFPAEGLLFEDLVETARANAELQPTGASRGGMRGGDFKVDRERRVKIETDANWIHNFDALPMRQTQAYSFIKRVFDLLIVLVLIPFFLPLFSLIALLIFLDDPGPVLYTQQRTGYGGRRFKLYKFRSMYTNAQVKPAQRVVYEDGSVRYMWPEKDDNDTRITRVGRVLRKTSLDELPQLLNILLGDMTLIGPRPTSWDLNMYTLQQTERLTVRPGITGLWQVCARESTNFDERVLWDIKYIENMSPWLDAQILWRTVSQVLGRGGA